MYKVYYISPLKRMRICTAISHQSTGISHLSVASGLGKVGQGGLSKKAQKVQADSGCKGI